MRLSRVLFSPLLLLAASCLHAQSDSWTARWLARVSATQAVQPQWATPVATVSGRLDQAFRADFLHQVTPAGDITNLDNGKGLELIPTRRTELLLNLPPWIHRENPASVSGWGDVSFSLKYRLWARNEEHGNFILTGVLGGSIPTGAYKNGSSSAIVTPTFAGGKGWGRFDVQATVGGTFPVNSVNTVGRTIVSNTAIQYHAYKLLWPETEVNSIFWHGGTNDGKKQTFITPGLIIGRFHLHNRIELTTGTGFQIAATHYHQYNHNVIGTIRLKF